MDYIKNLKTSMITQIDKVGKHSSLSLQDIIGLVSFILIFIVVIVSLILYKLYNDKSIEDNIQNMSLVRNTLNTNNITSTNFKDYRLGDYFIMGSYNSCCGGDYENDHVDTSTLADIIGMGVRFLDFEIYSVDGKTVVSSSSNDNIYKKGTYNELNIAEVFDIIQMTAFGHLTPNSNDPLFLHFRIKSSQKRVFDDLAKQIENKCKRKLLNTTFAYANRNKSIYNVPMKTLQSKIIICVESQESYFKQSPLYEYTNIHSGSSNCYLYRMQDIVNFINPEELTNRNRNHLSIVTPNFNNPDNFNSMIPIEYGCHILCMKFQKLDENLEFYVKQFNDANSAFMLRPKELRENTLKVELEEHKGEKGTLDTKVQPSLLGNLHI